MRQMTQSMEEIKAASDDISKIIQTIESIAFSTNILALNAAVEAARVGEAGQGFAVVADEVRSLAARCKESARETEDRIQAAIEKTGNGVIITRKVAVRLQEIEDKIRKVDTLVSELAQSNNEQSRGVTEVSSAVSQIDQVTQSNAASAEEGAGAAEELSQQARALNHSIDELLDLVGETLDGRRTEETSRMTPPSKPESPTRTVQPHASASASPQRESTFTSH
jgi:methyl-accepting chemotaxis protein